MVRNSDLCAVRAALRRSALSAIVCVTSSMVSVRKPHSRSTSSYIDAHNRTACFGNNAQRRTTGPAGYVKQPLARAQVEPGQKAILFVCRQPTVLANIAAKCVPANPRGQLCLEISVVGIVAIASWTELSIWSVSHDAVPCVFYVCRHCLDQPLPQPTQRPLTTRRGLGSGDVGGDQMEQRHTRWLRQAPEEWIHSERR